MPPGFMKATTGRVAPVEASSFWLSAIRLPRAWSSPALLLVVPVSPGALAGVRGRLCAGVEGATGSSRPSPLLAIGATSVF